jgi:hypothetical protein
VKSDHQFLGGVTSAAPSLAVKIDQGPKPFWFAADNRYHQVKAECTGANDDSGAPPTPTHIGSGF